MKLCRMGPVRVRHRSHEFATSPVLLCIELGGKPKWLPLIFGYHAKRHTGSHWISKSREYVPLSWWGLCALRHGIQISMEAILACHPTRSTEWLDCHPKSCELWHIRTGPIRSQTHSLGPGWSSGVILLLLILSVSASLYTSKSTHRCPLSLSLSLSLLSLSLSLSLSLPPLSSSE